MPAEHRVVLLVPAGSWRSGDPAFLSGLTQRFAGDANPITTVAYTHPSDEEIYERIGRI